MTDMLKYHIETSKAFITKAKAETFLYFPPRNINPSYYCLSFPIKNLTELSGKQGIIID